MITEARYLDLKAKERRFNSFHCKEHELKAAERKEIQVYEFTQQCPEKAVVYIKREVIPGAIATRKITVTSIDGAALGYGYLRAPYTVKGKLRYPIEFKAFNGLEYRGVFYHSRSYANVHRVSSSQPTATS